MATVVMTATATDFADTASYVGGALPSAGDVLEIREGSQNMTAGLTALIAIALNGFRVFPGFTGTIGSSGSCLVIRCDNGSNPTVQLNGTGAYINIAAHTTGGITAMEIRQNSGSVNVGGTGTITTLRAYTSNVYVLSGAVVTNLYVDGAVVDSDLNATAHTIADVQSGSLNMKRAATTLTVDASGRAVVLNAVAVTTANLRGGGALNYKSTGTLGTLNMYGASLFTPAGALTNVTCTTLNINSASAKFVSQAGIITCTPGTTNNNAGAPIYRDNSTGTVSPFA